MASPRDVSYPFPPGKPAHFLGGLALGILPPLAFALILPSASGILVLAGLAASLLLLLVGPRGYGCGLGVAVLFDLALSILLSFARGGFNPIF